MHIFTGSTPRELLIDKLCAMIIRKINCIHDRCFFEPPDRDWHILSMALERGWLTEERLRKAVHEGICRDGRVSYEQHMRNPRWTPPDHVYSAAALGYAIKVGAITWDESLLIQFDHGETLVDAMRWSGNIFEHTLAVVRDYKKLESRLPDPPKGIESGAWDYCEGCTCC